MSVVFAKGHPLPTGFFDGAIEQITRAQRADGAIAWFVNGTVDPWNHLEAVMGLATLGQRKPAEHGFAFLRNTQNADGSWRGQMGNAVPIDETLQSFTLRIDNLPFVRDTNHIAYIATATLHHYLIFDDIGFVKRMWAHICAALDFVLSYQSPHGDIRWAADEAQTPEDDSLISGCSSIYKSLEAALFLARLLKDQKPDWQHAHSLLGDALRCKPHRFNRQWESKEYFSMDWYYPVLSGAIQGAAAAARLRADWNKFVIEGAGCLCVSHEPWVTLAETAELALALLRAGQRAQAERMLTWLHQWRTEQGYYWMGRQVETNVFWPIEQPPWTAGAVILATDAVLGLTNAAQLFTSARYAPQHAQTTTRPRLNKQA